MGESPFDLYNRHDIFSIGSLKQVSAQLLPLQQFLLFRNNVSSAIPPACHLLFRLPAALQYGLHEQFWL